MKEKSLNSEESKEKEKEGIFWNTFWFAKLVNFSVLGKFYGKNMREVFHFVKERL